MAALKGAKTVGAGFKNQITYERVVYDYSVDGGATGNLDVLTANEDIVIKSFHAYVKTSGAGSGATLMVGVPTDTDALMTTSNGAVANLVAGAVVPVPATFPVALASGAKVTQAIGTAALTAGKVEYVFGIMRP